MKTRFKKTGYLKETADKYINTELPTRSLSAELEPQFKYEDGKRTTEITGYRAWFTQEGLPPFIVKFAREVNLPKYMALVNFKELQGIEIRYDVYFKAEDISEVK